MDYKEFLSTLFAAASSDRDILFHAPGRIHHRYCSPFAPDLTDEELTDPRGQMYFSLGLSRRTGTHPVDAFTLAWVDCDKDKPAAWYPRPTVTVSSGKGVHAYWALKTAVDPIVAIRMAKLAALAYGGDLKVCEPHRRMRLPGSVNEKYNPPRACEVESSGGGAYDPDELEEWLTAAVLAKHWEAGNRHALALAFAALMTRTRWEEDRVIRCVQHVCEITGDDDVDDRVRAVEGTYLKFQQGELVRAADLKEVMDKEYKVFIDVVGVTVRDGDLILDGETVGREFFVQRDIAEYIMMTKDWASLDGNLARWNGKIWESADSKLLVGEIFKILKNLRTFNQGVESEFKAEAGVAKAIKDVIEGILATQELPPLDAGLLPLENGVLNLDTRELLPHDRNYRARWIVPIEYDPDARAPLWEAFLAEAAPNEANFLQEWVGYCLRAGNPYQRMLWVFGPSGTGKSTFLQAVARLLGPACVSIKSGDISDYSVATLANARIGICAELSTRVLKTDKLKSLVASDPMVGRYPYGRPFQVIFEGKFIWASNSLPPVDQAEGLWRRLVVVPFEAVPAKVDPMLGFKLQKELPGILNWALEGLTRVDGYLRDEAYWALPEAVMAQVDEYREAADTFHAFVEDEFEADPREVFAVAEAYKRYQIWAKDRGFQAEPYGPVFWRALKSAGFKPVGTKRIGGRNQKVWSGASLRPEVFS